MDKGLLILGTVIVFLIILVFMMICSMEDRMQHELAEEKAKCLQAGESVYTCKMLEQAIKARHAAEIANMNATMAAGLAASRR